MVRVHAQNPHQRNSAGFGSPAKGPGTYWYYLACIDSTSMDPDPRTLSGRTDQTLSRLDPQDQDKRRRKLWIGNDPVAT